MGIINNNVKKVDMSSLMVELPKNVRRKITGIEKYKIWAYGKPYSGKTYFANTFKNTLFLNTDSNMEYVNSPFQTITDYTNLVAVVNALEVDKTFDTVCVDLIEDILVVCREHIMKQHDISHETEKPYGQGWDLVKTCFLSIVTRIIHLDKNIIFLSHSKEDSETIGGVVRQTSVPNLNKKFRDKLLGYFDFLVKIRTLNLVQTEGSLVSNHEVVLWDAHGSWVSCRAPLKLTSVGKTLKCDNDAPSFYKMIEDNIDYDLMNKNGMIPKEVEETEKADLPKKPKVTKKTEEVVAEVTTTPNPKEQAKAVKVEKPKVKTAKIDVVEETVDIDDIINKQQDSSPEIVEEEVLNEVDNKKELDAGQSVKETSSETQAESVVKEVKYANGMTEAQVDTLVKKHGLKKEDFIIK